MHRDGVLIFPLLSSCLFLASCAVASFNSPLPPYHTPCPHIIRVSFLSSHTRILFIPPHLAPAYCLFPRTSRPHTVYSPAPRACILFIPPHLAPAFCLFLRTSRLHKKISFCRFFIKKNLTGLFFTAILPPVFWVCSSAGEHYLHTVGAAGSIPATPTNKKRPVYPAFFIGLGCAGLNLRTKQVRTSRKAGGRRPVLMH